MSNVHKQAGLTVVTVSNPDFLGGKVQPGASKTRFSKEFTEVGGDGATINDTDHDLGFDLSLDVLILLGTPTTLFDIGTIVQYDIDGDGDIMYKIKGVTVPRTGGEALKYSLTLKAYDCADMQAAMLADPLAYASDGVLINS